MLPKRQQSIDELVSQFLKLNPVQHRSTLLPLVKNEEGNVRLGYPQVAVDMVKSLMLPGHVAQGGAFTDQDVTNMALDVGMMGAPVGMATAPRGSTC
jgi:hypothetical protein